MRNETYNFEIRTLVAQFVDALNDIVISRYNNAVDKEAQDKIHCNFIYAPKTRTLNDLVNPAKHIKPPIISANISSINRSVGRVFNKLEGPYYNLGPEERGVAKPLQPVPVDIGMNMSIITRFQSDMDQIITNFAPYNDPYITVSWKDPSTNYEIRTIIKWDGNIAFEYPIDIGPNTPYRIIANTSFVIEGWLFKLAESPAGKIYNINTTFNAVSSLNARYEELLADSDEDNTDYFTVSGRPFLRNIIPYTTIPCIADRLITVDGLWMDTLCGLYVSGSPGVFSSTYLYDPLSGNTSISALYPAFSGIAVSAWDAPSDSIMSFTMPSAVSAGYIDIIAYNEAGYGLLTEDAIRPTNNPYVSGTSEYTSYVEYQHPSISGVRVESFYYYCS